MFTSKHSNAKQWIETFEKECTRFDIIEDEIKIEILRLFLDKCCSDSLALCNTNKVDS